MQKETKILTCFFIMIGYYIFKRNNYGSRTFGNYFYRLSRMCFSFPPMDEIYPMGEKMA